ncbi:hypothetical protein Pmani_019068 [Petrolisthes manimaculis]|uniref:UPAR/Ly6 domain-containing protein n=1 Tax=Petrolisthes manimaculis TaxID=1843537 RepID=A0AAE1PIX0_9EUCA|nr:hypothetical protein Pmani_019068 [Petrolisthes manimaculis]
MWGGGSGNTDGLLFPVHIPSLPHLPTTSHTIHTYTPTSLLVYLKPNNTKPDKMKSTTICALLLVCLVSSAAALQCYECPDCGNSIGSIRTCDSPNDACMTISVKEHKSKACNVKFACDAISKMDLSRVWESLRDVFRGLGSDVSQSDMNSVKIECCEGNLCNGATNSLVSHLLLILAPILLFLLRN